ncbi:MAG: uncharacterized protein QOF28_1871 [Actinomycetota bacterium]|jgi:hypothetical protein|nr:uncharacterized protein [Actinomycetota bacterium]
MNDDASSDEHELDAGDFSAWMLETRSAIRGERAADVPCNGCTACCTSSQFVHIEPDEIGTLSRIPAELVFPAPLMPRGHVLLGYDERGHCPMLIDNRCSIYEHRPRTCRTYDCRVFPATGIDLDDDPGKALIAQRVKHWRFAFPEPTDRIEHDATVAAATFLAEHGDLFPHGVVPSTATQRAVLAIKIHHIFLRRDAAGGDAELVDPDPGVVRAEVLRCAGEGRGLSRGR